MKSNFYDLIIIGAGIAGCTAAIYAARNRMKFLLLTNTFGGQFMESGEILNYPGLIKITGFEFSQKMKEQLKFNKIKPEIGIVVQKIIKNSKNRIEKTFIVKTNKVDYHTKTIIIATGAKHRELNIPGEQKYKNKGVTYCSICDGPLYKNKTVAVIGGGNSALQAANSLLKIAKKIFILTNESSLRAYAYLKENILNNPKIELILEAEAKEIIGNKLVTGLKFNQKGKTKKIDLDGIFVEIGRRPNTEFAQGLLKLDEHEHIIINCDTSTSIPGIFAVGDCSSVHEYQYIIAAGQGCTALLKVNKYLAGKK